MFCALLTSRYQVSVYRTNGPLVLFTVNPRGVSNKHCLLSLFSFCLNYRKFSLKSYVVDIY